MNATGATDVGKRKHNEDAFCIDAALGLVLVADGVGGHEAGEVASALTCETICREMSAHASLVDAVRSANQEVMAAVGQGRGKAGMASTVVAVRLSGSEYQIAWVGDSRIYLWDGQLKLLTLDHSYVQALLNRGQITLEEARNHPRRNVIVQAIGLQDNAVLQVGENNGSLEAGQILLLCSDGLSDVVDSSRIAEILAAGDSLDKSCKALVDEAVHAGGGDNITAVLLAGDGQQDLAERTSPNIVWSYDPVSGEYSGLPEQTLAAPVVRRMMPKGAAPDSPENTQIIPVGPLVDLNKIAAGGTRRRWLLWAVLASVVVGSVLYSLALEGAFK